MGLWDNYCGTCGVTRPIHHMENDPDSVSGQTCKWHLNDPENEQQT